MVESIEKSGPQYEDSFGPDLVKPKGWGCRHTLAFLGFLGFTLLHGMRVNLSLAIVAMVQHKSSTASLNNSLLFIPSSSSNPLLVQETFVTTAGFTAHSTVDFDNFKHLENGSADLVSQFTNKESTNPTSKLILQHRAPQDNEPGSFGGDETFSTEKIHDNGFDWDERSQGAILGAMYWGTLISKIPGGLTAQRFGGKWTLGIAMFGAASATVLIPIVSVLSWRFLVVVRAFQGLCDGFCSPSMHTLLAKWSPPNERSKLATIIYAGGQLGTAITMLMTGYIIGSDFLSGWPAAFYIIGSLAILWSITFLIFASDSPETCSRISEEEMIYIQRSIGSRIANKQKLAVPWRSMLVSMPVWAIVVGNTADSWGFYTFLTELPTYMKTVLQFDIKANSWLSALPYLLSWGFSVLLTQIADYFIAYKKVPIIIIRKACETIGHLGSAVCLILASYAGYSQFVLVTLLTVGIAINAATYGGYAVNSVDIAPQHAGVLMAFCSTIANVCAIAAPYVAGLLINQNPSMENWQIVFFITAAIYIFDTVFYLVFAKAEEQSWAKPTTQSSTVL